MEMLLLLAMPMFAGTRYVIILGASRDNPAFSPESEISWDEGDYMAWDEGDFIAWD